ncbi:MAG TPA: CAP domain-containing protein [Acidimicrobiia bacterium]|jgi:hypothetical protein
MQGKRRWLTLSLVASLALFVVGTTAGADSGTEGEFLSKINATRAANGLGSLKVDGGLQSHARAHTQDMIDAGEIFHSSSGELSSAGGKGWDKIGENVGRGQSTTSLHEAFMKSSGHKDNILGDYNYVGIGTGSSDGYLYVTVVFMKKGTASSPTTTTAPPTTTTAPATTTTAPADTPADVPAPVESSGKTSPAAAPTTTSPTTTTTVAPTTTTSLIVPPDKPVTAGQSCVEANRYFQLCHD